MCGGRGVLELELDSDPASCCDEEGVSKETGNGGSGGGDCIIIGYLGANLVQLYWFPCFWI